MSDEAGESWDAAWKPTVTVQSGSKSDGTRLAPKTGNACEPIRDAVEGLKT